MDSDLQSNITQGRIIPRLVSMFDSVDEMVEENDRRQLDEDLLPEDRDQPTPEHVSLLGGTSFANGKQSGAPLSRIREPHPANPQSQDKTT